MGAGYLFEFTDLRANRLTDAACWPWLKNFCERFQVLTHFHGSKTEFLSYMAK